MEENEANKYWELIILFESPLLKIQFWFNEQTGIIRQAWYDKITGDVVGFRYLDCSAINIKNGRADKSTAILSAHNSFYEYYLKAMEKIHNTN
jgi:hypothetical protein